MEDFPMRKLAAPLLLVMVAFLAVQAGASLITSIPGGTVVPMPTLTCVVHTDPCYGTGPHTFGPGITWTSTNASSGGGSVFGNAGHYDFGTNGYWTGALGPMAGLNWSSDFFPNVVYSMTFAFTNPVSSVGGFLNYYGQGSNPTTIAVYDANNHLIESYDLNFATGGGANVGAFYGFEESQSIIKYFKLSDNYVGITKLTYAAVPEPGSLFLLGSGLLGAFGYARRRVGM
jgi:hypothetical protein